MSQYTDIIMRIAKQVSGTVPVSLRRRRLADTLPPGVMMLYLVIRLEIEAEAFRRTHGK